MILPLTITGNDTDWRTAFNKLESRIIHWSQQRIDGYNISSTALGDGLYYSGIAALSSDPNTTIPPKITNALADTTRGSYINIDRDTGDGDTEYIDIIGKSNIYLRAFSTIRTTATLDLQNTRILGNITFSSPGAGANSERYGAGAVAAGASGVAIGGSAVATSADTVAIGYSASAGANSEGCVVIGKGASSDTNGYSDTIVIGRNALATSANQIMLNGAVSCTDTRLGSRVQLSNSNGALRTYTLPDVTGDVWTSGGNNTTVGSITSTLNDGGYQYRGPVGGDTYYAGGVRADTGAGRAAVLQGAAAVTTGKGGTAAVYAGAATGNNQDGGDVHLYPGAPTGSGVAGAVRVATATDLVGFYGIAPVALQTGVAVTAAGIHAALVNLGLITA